MKQGSFTLSNDTKIAHSNKWETIQNKTAQTGDLVIGILSNTKSTCARDSWGDCKTKNSIGVFFVRLR